MNTLQEECDGTRPGHEISTRRQLHRITRRAAADNRQNPTTLPADTAQGQALVKPLHQSASHLIKLCRNKSTSQQAGSGKIKQTVAGDVCICRSMTWMTCEVECWWWPPTASCQEGLVLAAVVLQHLTHGGTLPAQERKAYPCWVCVNTSLIKR